MSVGLAQMILRHYDNLQRMAGSGMEEKLGPTPDLNRDQGPEKLTLIDQAPLP